MKIKQRSTDKQRLHNFCCPVLAGKCLILLDGLDEVSNPVTRQKVQEAIGLCIRNHRGEHVRPDDATGQQNRFVINSIKVDEDSWINALVERASRLDDLWREPFLLAVAYQGNENEVVANKILSSFVTATPTNPLLQHVSHLCLAAHAVIESKLGILDSALERKIADQLLRAYERAQREQAFKQCEQK